MATYKNPWHNPRKPWYGPAQYETSAVPVPYRGLLIYNRINAIDPNLSVWDIVTPGSIFKKATCISQAAGLEGAKRIIDGARDAEPHTVSEGSKS